MLVYVFACVLLSAPVLQAVFDLPLQLAFQQAIALTFLAWCWLKPPAERQALRAYGKKFPGLWAAAALSLLALLASPFKGDIFSEWANYGAGLLIFIAASFLNKEERVKTDRAAAAGAWLVFALVLAQILVLENLATRPPLTNLNALALYAVMALPLAVARKNWLLAAAMGSIMLVSQSLGAVLASLAAAGIYAAGRFNRREDAGNKWLLAVMLVLAVPIFYCLQADSMAGRLAWWKSAWEMFAARPLTGFGHAAFTWAQAGFQSAGAFREHSIYAHNYYLEFLAENGLPAAAAWFWFLLAAVRSRKGVVKYSIIGALLHSCVDFGLSVPANFWFFCYLLAEPRAVAPAETMEPAHGVKKFPAAAVFVLALLLEAAWMNLALKSIAFQKAGERAVAAALPRSAGHSAPGRADADGELLPYLNSRLFRGPALELLGRLSLAGPGNRDNGLSSAVYYEMALLENPYNPRAWRALGQIYGVPGREASAAGLAARKAGVYK